MNEEQLVAPSEAAAEGVTEATEALETTVGQAEGQPAEGTPPEEKKSASQERRERRKAHEQHLRVELAKATEAARNAEAFKERIRAAAAGEQAPKEGDFRDPVEYAAALGAYQSGRAYDQRAERDAEAQAEAARQQAQTIEGQRHAELVAQLEDDKVDARGRYQDFDAVFASAIIPNHVAPLILESDAPADLAYHLGKNPALARQIAQLPAVAAAREIGRIEASLKRPQPITQSNAPAPINPLRGGGTAAKDPAKMTPAEYRKYRESGGRPG